MHVNCYLLPELRMAELNEPLEIDANAKAWIDLRKQACRQ